MEVHESHITFVELYTILVLTQDLKRLSREISPVTALKHSNTGEIVKSCNMKKQLLLCVSKPCLISARNSVTNSISKTLKTNARLL